MIRINLQFQQLLLVISAQVETAINFLARQSFEAPVRNGVLELVDNVKRGRGRPKLTWLSRLRETLRIGTSLRR